MPCYAMPCQTKFCPGLTQVHKSSFFDVNTPVCFNVVSSLDRGRTRAAATSRDGHYPPPTDIARALVPVPEVLRHGCCNQLPSPRGTRDSPPPPVGGPLRTTRNGNLVPMVAYSEPSAFAAAPAHAPAPISLSTFSRAGPGPPQHPICGGPSVQRVVSESCVLWHCVPCTHRSTPLLQTAD